MRIDDSNLKNIASQPAKSKVPNDLLVSAYGSGYGKIRDASADASSGATDTFTLSSLSSAINAQSEDTPERSAKLEKLAKDVDAGRYKPYVQETTRKLIEESLSKDSLIQDQPASNDAKES